MIDGLIRSVATFPSDTKDLPMRIPPTVAREIGQMYSAARVNDAAAARLGESSEYLTSAIEFAGRGDFEAAASDAWSAASLLEQVTSSTDTSLDRGVQALATSAFTDATAAAKLLESGAGAGNLGGAAGRASDAAALATRAAAGYRASADQLAREWM